MEPAPHEPALRVRDARWLLLLILGLQLFAWSRLEGYQLADSVEYMDRAVQVVEGQRMDPGTVRSFARPSVSTSQKEKTERRPAGSPRPAAKVESSARSNWQTK